MSSRWNALALTLCVAVLWACDDDPPDDDDCADVESPCVSASERRCSETAGEVEVCSENADGCLEWQADEGCGERQHCEGQGECVCENTCDTADVSSCDGTIVVECVLDADGCLYERDQRDCEDTEQSCEVVDGDAMCVGCAENVCDDSGAVRCLRDAIQTCSVRDDGCLDWETTTDCAELDPPQLCSDDGGTAECVEGCSDDCETAGEMRCAEAVIETCVIQDDECLDWIAGTDCADVGYCDDSGVEAVCQSCDDTCATEGATRCVGSVVETCIADIHGCLKWEIGTDCATLDPVQICIDDSGEAACEELPGSGSCSDPIEVRVEHFVLAGTDFTADFADDQTLAGADCETRPGSPDAVFSLDIAAGQTVRVRETSDFDAVLSLMTDCSDAAVCEFSEDIFESDGYGYTATEDETVYIVVEPFDDVPRILYYEIRIDIVETEVCDNDIDDDADGAADCDDDECYGVGPCATEELNCSDEGDNDDDGATDCDDSDCDDDPVCGPFMGVYEVFPYDEAIDLQGNSVVFTPDGSDANGYIWSTSTITDPDFAVTPGTGTVSMVMALADDATEMVTLSLLPEFPFYGESYSVLYLGSNGYITFGDWDIIAFPDAADFFDLPTVAGLWTDLAPDRVSTAGDPIVTVDEFADRVVVTFEDTPIFYDEFVGMVEGPNDLQMILNADGSIEIDWVTVNTPSMDVVVGISNGIGTGDIPDPVDLVP